MRVSETSDFVVKAYWNFVEHMAMTSCSLSPGRSLPLMASGWVGNWSLRCVLYSMSHYVYKCHILAARPCTYVFLDVCGSYIAKTKVTRHCYVQVCNLPQKWCRINTHVEKLEWTMDFGKQFFLRLHLANSLSTQRFTEITSFTQAKRLLSRDFPVNF